MINFIMICGLEFNKYETSKYVISSLYLSNKDVIVMLTFREIHIVNNLKINILINMNIIMLKQINILTS